MTIALWPICLAACEPADRPETRPLATANPDDRRPAAPQAPAATSSSPPAAVPAVEGPELEEAQPELSSDDAPARTDRAPSYDTVAYCERIGDTARGSYVIERTCRDMEAQARDAIQDMDVPRRIAAYCDKIGETVGGSYQIYQTCVEQESGAAAAL